MSAELMKSKFVRRQSVQPCRNYLSTYKPPALIQANREKLRWDFLNSDSPIFTFLFKNFNFTILPYEETTIILKNLNYLENERS